jgi:3-oxoacyl-[acyl-carrier protein] reductase
MSLVQNKVVLVTGASRGIGRAIATTFAKAGANVAFTYLSSVEKGQALEQELAAFGITAKGYRSDASSYTESEKLVDEVLAD